MKRWVIPAIALFAFSMFFGGVAVAHIATVPPPEGPYAYYDNPNGMFGVFCARAYIQIYDTTGGTWQTGAATSTWYTPNGWPLCDTPLNLAANDIYVDAVQLKNGNFCGFDFEYNLNNQPSAAVGFNGCTSSGTGVTDGYHEAWLYGQLRTKGWNVTH